MIKITKCPEPSLQAIKLLRINSGVGLREAKDLVDTVIRKGQVTFSPVLAQHQVIPELESAGFTVERVADPESPFKTNILMQGLDTAIQVNETVGEISDYELLDSKGFLHLNSDETPVMVALDKIITYSRID